MKKNKLLFVLLVSLIVGCRNTNISSNTSSNSSDSTISNSSNSSLETTSSGSSISSSESNSSSESSSEESSIVSSEVTSTIESSSESSESESISSSSSESSSSSKSSSEESSIVSSEVTSSIESSSESSASESISSSSSESSSNSSNSGPSSSPDSSMYIADIDSNAPDYYESVRGLKGLELKKALHNLIKGHTTFGYNSNINKYMKIYDADYNDPSKINLIYTGSASKNAEFNKEHVWAKSHGNFGTATGPGSDLHNLRPSYVDINSTRGNKDFAEGGTELSKYKGNYQTSSTFEPRDDFKGDVARTIFYMATRYEGNEGGYPDLELNRPSNVSKYLDLSSEAKGVHGNFDDLYKWATSGIDPVDNYEVNRNNIIYKDYQHNRNPFVDHPEFIIMIYDKNYNGEGALNDLTGAGQVSDDEQAQKVYDLIMNLGEITLQSENKIIEAETAYSKLSNNAKLQIPSDVYQILLDARETYDTLYEQNIVNIVISLIDEIGEVTLDSEEKIVKAETEYNKLSSSQKESITNYSTLVLAREKLDELKQSSPSLGIIYEGLLKDVTGVSASYKSYTFALNNKKWYVSNAYMQGEEFRLGHNKPATVDNKFMSAIGLSTMDGSSLEMLWDINNSNGITFTIDGTYGTVNNVYILQSTDGGNTYTKCVEFTYSESLKEYSYSGKVDSSVRYAIVISGTKPRVKLSKIQIFGNV